MSVFNQDSTVKCQLLTFDQARLKAVHKDMCVLFIKHNHLLNHLCGCNCGTANITELSLWRGIKCILEKVRKSGGASGDIQWRIAFASHVYLLSTLGRNSNRADRLQWKLFGVFLTRFMKFSSFFLSILSFSGLHYLL